MPYVKNVSRDDDDEREKGLHPMTKNMTKQYQALSSNNNSGGVSD